MNCEDELRIAKERIKELEENDMAFPLRLYMALEEFMDKDKNFYFPDILDINVYDPNLDIYRSISIDPKDLICITGISASETEKNKGRKKRIFTKKSIKENDTCFDHYILNNNFLNFEKLKNAIDPFSHYLFQVSRNFLINVKFYDLSTSNELHLNLTGDFPKEIKNIPIPKTKHQGFLIEKYKQMRDSFDSRISLQKKVLGYKFSMGIDH